MHPLGRLITERMELPDNKWSLADVVRRMVDAGHRNIGKSRLGQIRKYPVESVKADVIFALADGLGVTPLTVANAALESMGINPRPAETTDAIATINIDPSLSEASRRALIALIREMRQDPLRDHRLKIVPLVADAARATKGGGPSMGQQFREGRDRVDEAPDPLPPDDDHQDRDAEQPQDP